MSAGLPIEIRHRPVLDPGFLPAILWNKAYEARVAATAGSPPLVIALDRPDETCFVHRTQVLPHEGENVALNRRYVERLVKFLLWQKGGNHLTIGGEDHICSVLSEIYSENGERVFDRETMGRKMFRAPISVEVRAVADMPGPKEATVTLGRHLDGCRIGFDLGGSDRKCAAVVDGEVVFSEEVAWDPYFQADPQYHFNGIDDTIRRAAERLPRVDSIGGSSAGAYANNEVLVASLFRGISDGDFETHVRRIFWRLKEKWGGVPFEVTNDGEVTALAGSMSLNDNCCWASQWVQQRRPVIVIRPDTSLAGSTSWHSLPSTTGMARPETSGRATSAAASSISRSRPWPGWLPGPGSIFPRTCHLPTAWRRSRLS